MLTSETECTSTSIEQSQYFNNVTAVTECIENKQIETLSDQYNENIKNSSNLISVVKKPENKIEPLLAKVMKRCLGDALHEGLLDNVLPYMLPKRVHSQPIMRKPVVMELRKSSSTTNGFENRVVNVITTNKEKDKEKNKQKKCME